jgi:acetyltransferase-like isoleucine patch superfamily enzyme
MRPQANLPRPLHDYLRSPLHTLRLALSGLNARWQLRSAASLGPLTRIRGRLHVRNRGTLTIGDRVQFVSDYARTVLAVLPGATLDIGDRTFINYGCDICAARRITIGPDCLLGTHVIILDSSHHELHDRLQRPEPSPVQICEGAWIGNRSLILPGVTIGQGAVVGAGSVVTRDVPPRSVVAGNPATLIRELDDADGSAGSTKPAHSRRLSRSRSDR